MTEIGNKKRRIARIGTISGDKETTKLHSEDGLMQDDCNLVYNIMQSMNNSHVMSYQQLQEFRSKEKSTRSKNSDQNSSNKQSSKVFNSKQMKKYVPEKSFPLMQKCQKSMKYLKKNRCIPKPRAHVGSIPRPNPISSLQPNNICNNPTITDNAVNLKDSSMKNKQSSCPSEKNNKLKKTKASHSVDNPYDINVLQKSFDKKPNLTSDVDISDSDNEFERFLQKHNSGKSIRRKSNKSKRKKNKKLISAKKLVKVTSKTLPASESEVECNTLTENKSINVDEFSSKRFQRIIEYENNDDSATDTHVNDTGTLNYDSSSSSEDENMINKSLNKENSVDFNESIRLETIPAEQSSILSSTFSSEHKDSCCDALKLKCKIPCYVVIIRDPLLDKKAALLRAGNSVMFSTLPASNPYDEDDDCIIIEASTNNFANKKTENSALSVESRNSNRGELSIISNSPRVSEASNMNNVLNQELISSSNRLKLHTETNEKFGEILFSDKNMPLEVHIDEKEFTRSVAPPRKSLRDKEGDEYFTLNKAASDSYKNVNSVRCEDESTSVVDPLPQHASDISNETVSLSCDSATEKEMFKVQILSVESLNDIVLSDDNEEKDTDSVPAINKSKESADEDSDVEIICLDSCVNKQKCVNENVLNSETRNEVKVSMKEDSSSPSALTSVSIEDDCVILDDLGIPNKNTCPSKNVGKEQQSFQADDAVNNEITNSKKDGKTANNELESVKEEVLKTLETIDFNLINKLKTVPIDTREEDIPAKVENSSHDNIETSDRTLCSYPEKLEQTQNDACLSQKQTSINTSITPVGPFEVNIKISSLNATPVEIREKRLNLVQNSNTLHTKSCSENVSNLIRQNSISSTSENHKSFTINVNSCAAKSFVSEKEVTSSCKTESNALIHSRKNKQLLPVCTKVECHESPSDELDIIAAKSIQSLDEKEKESIVPLLELYRAEYKRFMEIKCTEQNVTAGLKLLEEKQAKKLLAISSSIKNIVKNDECFHKINNEFKSKTFIKSDTVEKNESLDEIKKPLEFVSRPSINSYPDIEKDDKVRIFNKSVVERASEVLKSDGPSSSQEMSYWSKGHFATCKR
ncbi:unnamed protein product [Larinioides sclopetarius]|uniref:Uncharacterized protein n=1 Tax=Larinioides sclopetarius TaxID=280406 RepID=A0AAV2B3J8_9ARAC